MSDSLTACLAAARERFLASVSRFRMWFCPRKSTMIGYEHDRALSQVIGSSFERQPVKADPRMSILRDRLDGPLKMRFIACQNTTHQRQVHSGTGCDLNDHAQIFRQTGSAEGQAGP